MSLEQYLQLLDWSGRQVARNKVGRIPEHLAPILDRLGIRQEGWMALVTSLGKLFRRIIGDPSAVEQQAARSGKKWFQGIANCRQLFVERSVA